MDRRVPTLRSGLFLNGHSFSPPHKTKFLVIFTVGYDVLPYGGERPQLPQTQLQRRPAPILSGRLAQAVGRVMNSAIAVFSVALIARLWVLFQFLPAHGW